MLDKAISTDSTEIRMRKVNSGDWETWRPQGIRDSARCQNSTQHSQLIPFPGKQSPWDLIILVFSSVQFSLVQSLSSVQLFETPWIAARQASLSITNSRSLLKLMSIESVMPSSHLILYHPLLLLPPIPPSIRVFSNDSTLPWGCQSIGVSASVSVLPIRFAHFSSLSHS